jgi:chromosome segregation ATPase
MSSRPSTTDIINKSPSGSFASPHDIKTVEVEELKKTINELLITKSAMSKRIENLKKELESSSGGNMTDSPVDELSQQLTDCKKKLQERDGAITTLVKSSITQEQIISALREEINEVRRNSNGNGHANNINNNAGPSWQEYTKLQQESEMFAGQIIELDEEIEDLRRQLSEKDSMLHQRLFHQNEAKEYEARIENLKSTLLQEKAKVVELESYMDRLKSKLKNSSNLDRVRDELEEVEKNNEQLSREVRELRRKMRSAQLEADRVPDLESEISSLKDALNKMKISNAQMKSSEAMETKFQNDLQRAIDERKSVQGELKKSQDKCLKLEDEVFTLEDQVQAMEKELKELQDRYHEMEESLKNQLDSEKSRVVALTESNEASESKLRRTTEVLKRQIKELENDIDEQNGIISALTNEVKKLRSNSVEDSDANALIIALTEEVKKLRSKQMLDKSEDADVIDALTQEVKNLHAALQQREGEDYSKVIESTIRSEVTDELRSMKEQKDFLASEVKRLQMALDSTDNNDVRVKELKKQLEDAEKERVTFEKTTISTYERKLNLMQMNKDLTIDGLRKELSQCKERQKKSEAELLNRIRSLESEKRETEAELQAKMQHKNAKIKFLEQTLSAHEQVSGHMKDELDQLQSGMETVSVTRRAEVEELQEELMNAQGMATRYEREITSLKMEMEEIKLQHNNEIQRLQSLITTLENEAETPMMRDVAFEREKKLESDYRQQLKDLMTKVNILQEENMDLKQKIDKETRHRSSNNDKWRNSALQEQIIKLKQRLREYEGDSESVRSGSSRRSTIPRSPAQSS